MEEFAEIGRMQTNLGKLDEITKFWINVHRFGYINAIEYPQIGLTIPMIVVSSASLKS